MPSDQDYKSAKEKIRIAAADSGMNVKGVETHLKKCARSGTGVPTPIASSVGGQDKAEALGKILVSAHG